MIPLVSQVYTRARAAIGDYETDPDVYTDAILEPHYQIAYTELYDAMVKNFIPLVRLEMFANIPINTGYLDPATAGITNEGQIEAIEERGNLTAACTVIGATQGTALIVITTSAPHGLSTGNLVTSALPGLSEQAQGEFYITVTGVNTLTLNGCVATGTYTTGGCITLSNDQWYPMGRVNRLINQPVAPGGQFQVYSWDGGIIRFPASGSERQLKIVYLTSGDAPTAVTAKVGIDNSLNFLGMRTGGLAFATREGVQRAQQMNFLAVGPAWDAAGIAGGMLGRLIEPGVRNLQQLVPSQRRPPAWGFGRRRPVW